MLRTGAWTVEIPDDVCHSGFVAHHGGQVHGFLGVILTDREVAVGSIDRAHRHTFGNALTLPR